MTDAAVRPHLAQHMLLCTQEQCATDVNQEWLLHNLDMATTGFCSNSTLYPDMAARLSLKNRPGQMLWSHTFISKLTCSNPTQSHLYCMYHV